MDRITPVLCALVSAACFYFATGLGGSISTTPGLLWVLAFLSPVPVLWLAFRPTKAWVVFAAAFAGGALGACNMLPAYLGVLPLIALISGIVAEGLILAASVMAARFVARRLSPVSGVVAFAAIWTGLDYLSSLDINGAALSPAYSQVEFPFNIQIASLFGLWAVTAVMGLFAAGTAMFAATRKKEFAIFAAAVVLLNGGYGAWRIAGAPQTDVVHVGLAGDDSLIRQGVKDDETSALSVLKAYGTAAGQLASRGANLIVIPEKIAVLETRWRGAADAELITAAHVGHALIVAGFDQRDGRRLNTARVYFANGVAPQTYLKRRMVPGLEAAFMPGQSSFMLSDRTGVAICKDMDYPAMIRGDAMLGPDLYAVPAWDFDRDAVWHARLAIMRGVENGFSLARAANDGLLTLSDAYGRILAIRATSEGGMVTLQGDLPRGPGRTLYAAIGDMFAWIAAALGVLLLGVAFLAGYRKQDAVV